MLELCSVQTIGMKKKVAIVGAGVSGLTCGVIFADAGYRVTIFAEETGQQTTSAAAAAIWYPYDAKPADKIIAWALETYRAFEELSRAPQSGVSMIELRTFSRTSEIIIPAWAHSLGARSLPTTATFPSAFVTGFTLTVPLRCLDLIINCTGIGARRLVSDLNLEAHRGQVAIVPKLDLPYAIVSDDPPLMYAIPRTNDCVFGGTNERSNDRVVDPAARKRIIAECSRILEIAQPEVIADRVGLRPFRKSGVRLETDRLTDGRLLIHNYGHGGAGFTLSWACARKVFALANSEIAFA